MPTILFAEDKPSYHKQVVDALRATGYTVTAVENGADAIEALEHQTFDLVLTDFCMPFKDGSEVARAAQKKGIQRIIINSAMASEIEPIAGVDIVAKMTAEELVRKVEVTLAV